jgi:L-fucose mutarotase
VLKGLDPLLTPELLRVLAAMGHGDEICLADANFPAASVAGEHPLLRLPIVSATRALEAVMSLLPLDTFVKAPAAVMQVVGDPEAVPPPAAEFQAVIERVEGRPVPMEAIERFAFYERARHASAIVVTGERRPYGNILLRKGVIFAT